MESQERMTDNDIIKAMECCLNKTIHDYSCESCPLKESECMGGWVLMKAAFDLINRQKAEIERLQHIRAELSRENDSLKVDIESACKLLEAKREEERREHEKMIGDLKELASLIPSTIACKKAEAVKEFAEKLKDYVDDLTIHPYTEGVVPCIKAKIKQIAEEMTEGEDASDFEV